MTTKRSPGQVIKVKVTLDTNILISQNGDVWAARLHKLEKNGLIDIAVTTRVVADKDQDKDESRKLDHLALFSNYPKIGTVGRWDYSRWDSGDFWATEESVELENRIKRIVFGDIKADDKRRHNKISDIDHLVGHYLSNREIFITNDHALTRKSTELDSQFGLKVESPERFLQRYH